MTGGTAYISALLSLPSILFPLVSFQAFSHRMHTAGIDPQPTPSLLHFQLWSVTHKAYLTFIHWLQAVFFFFYLFVSLLLVFMEML